jgi:serine/threonine protein kinase
LIHRDIKPANVMVCQRGGLYDVVKLLDFGLVKAVDAEREGGLTASNALTGTPLYLSPEAFVATESVDARSDLYSLGALAYYLLTGTTVFTGKNLIDICRQHVDAPPIPPSIRLGRSVDLDLESLILRCLAKQPADRPASAAEVADALTHCASAGTWTVADAREWWSTCVAGQVVLGTSMPPTHTGEFAATVLGATQPPLEH